MKRSSIWNGFFTAGIVLIIMSLVLLTAMGIYGVVVINYRYNNAVHSHLENAYWAADPATMKNEILLAKQGMEDLGLEPSDWGVFWSWKKTPDNRMQWQYAHIDSVITRIDEFQSWEASQKGSSGSQQMQDVYSSKLNNIRTFIKDEGGWSDWIAKSAFELKYYLWAIIIEIAAVIILIIGFVFVVAGLIYHDMHRYED